MCMEGGGVREGEGRGGERKRDRQTERMDS